MPKLQRNIEKEEQYKSGKDSKKKGNEKVKINPKNYREFKDKKSLNQNKGERKHVYL